MSGLRISNNDTSMALFHNFPRIRNYRMIIVFSTSQILKFCHYFILRETKLSGHACSSWPSLLDICREHLAAVGTGCPEKRPVHLRASKSWDQTTDIYKKKKNMCSMVVWNKEETGIHRTMEILRVEYFQKGLHRVVR